MFGIMINKTTMIILFLTAIFSGLVAGLLYSYSCSVNVGLKLLSDIEYIKAMQSISKAIQNPVFFVSFMGLLFLFPVTVYQQYSLRSNSLRLLISAMVIYFVGVMAITVFGNVPLNEQLAKFQTLFATQDEVSSMRQNFEKPWNKLHTIRAIPSIVSFSLTILYIIEQRTSK